MQRYAFVCLFRAWPPRSGATTVTWHSARHIPGRSYLVQVGHPGERCSGHEGVELRTVGGGTGRWDRLLGLWRRISQIVDHVRQIEPEWVVLEGASWTPYLLFLMNALRRKVPHVRIAYHAHNVDSVLRQEGYGLPLRCITRFSEARLLAGADRAFAVSAVDQYAFERLYGARVGLWPNGVDIDGFDRVTDDQIAQVHRKHGLVGRVALFMGLYEYPPNRHAVQFLIEQVWPVVLRRCHAARLAVIGGNVPMARPWLVNPGRIPYEDLAATIKACDVGVAPVFSGSGTRLKILDSMAGRLPVVASAKGAEGLDAQDGRDLLLAERSDEFADAIVRLLSHRGLAASIGQSGYALVRGRYAWPAVMASVCRQLNGE